MIIISHSVDEFIFSTIPVHSMPPGATHRLRVWVKTLVPLIPNPVVSQPLPFNDSVIYHRIYKAEDFKVGGRLEFHSLGNRLVMAFPRSGGPETITMRRAPTIARDKEKELSSIPETSTIQPYSHYLPPGAQHPRQPGYQADLEPVHHQSQSSDPTTQLTRLQPLRAVNPRDHAPVSRIHKSRGKIVWYIGPLYRTTLLTILHDWMPYILSYTEQSLLRRCLVPLFIDIV